MLHENKTYALNKMTMSATVFEIHCFMSYVFDHKLIIAIRLPSHHRANKLSPGCSRRETEITKPPTQDNRLFHTGCRFGATATTTITDERRVVAGWKTNFRRRIINEWDYFFARFVEAHHLVSHSVSRLR